VLLAIDRASFRLPRRQWPIMIVLGIVGVALLQATYAAAVQRLPVGIALLLEYTAVLMVALVAYFFFKEQVKTRLWIAIVLVLAGLAVVARVWASTLDAIGVLLAIAAAVGSLGGLISAGPIEGWYAAAPKPMFAPPDAVFGPVWAVLYVLIAVAGWLVWRAPDSEARTRGLRLYVAQFALNALWTPVFFGLGELVARRGCGPRSCWSS